MNAWIPNSPCRAHRQQYNKITTIIPPDALVGERKGRTRSRLMLQCTSYGASEDPPAAFTVCLPTIKERNWKPSLKPRAESPRAEKKPIVAPVVYSWGSEESSLGDAFTWEKLVDHHHHHSSASIFSKIVPIRPKLSKVISRHRIIRIGIGNFYHCKLCMPLQLSILGTDTVDDDGGVNGGSPKV